MYWYFSLGVFHILNIKFSKIVAEHLKKQSRRTKHRKQDNIKIYLEETRCNDVKLFRCFRIGSVLRYLE
jgi:hypothetical protein